MSDTDRLKLYCDEVRRITKCPDSELSLEHLQKLMDELEFLRRFLDLSCPNREKTPTESNDD